MSNNRYYIASITTTGTDSFTYVLSEARWRDLDCLLVVFALLTEWQTTLFKLIIQVESEFNHLLLYNIWLAGSKVKASVYRATAVEKSPAWHAAFEALTFSTNRALDAAPREAEPVGSTCKRKCTLKTYYYNLLFIAALLHWNEF